MHIGDQSLKKFTEQLSASTPIPGGGAAAALTAALGISLASMVAGINSKRMLDNSAKKRILSLELDRKALLLLMDEDTAAFKEICSFKKEDRGGLSYETALKNATLTPLKMCEIACRGLETLLPEQGRTSLWLQSDYVESAILLKAAFLAARLNVLVNVKSIKDLSFVKQINKKLAQMELKIKKNKIHA